MQADWYLPNWKANSMASGRATKGMVKLMLTLVDCLFLISSKIDISFLKGSRK